MMDSAEDIEMPSPKRQRTESPVVSTTAALHAATKVGVPASHVTTGGPKAASIDTKPTIPGLGMTAEEEIEPRINAQDVSILDTLMQHVESEAGSEQVEQVQPVETPLKETYMEGVHTMNETSSTPQDDHSNSGHAIKNVVHHELLQSSTNHTDEHMQHSPSRPTPAELAAAEPEEDAESALRSRPLPQGLIPADPSTIDHLHHEAISADLPPTADTLVQDHIQSATTEQEQKEWESDSSPYSSSTDSSDSSDDDSEEEEENEYELLDPYEQARILMADAGSDDEDSANPRRGAHGASSGLRTANEKSEEIMPKPNILITSDMKIEELGMVDNIVENTLLVRARTTGEYQVLESNSLLCLADRRVIGVVAETLGRIEQPLYTVRFASQTDIEESGVGEKGTMVYYVPDHSSFVFTQPLKGIKGSDASNFHDEEVGDEEMEFSDDEAEAEHKRLMKMKRKGIDPSEMPGRGGRGRGRAGRGGERGRGRGGFSGSGSMSAISETNGAYTNGSMQMNYDDNEDGEAKDIEYTPLQRPVNLHETITGNEGPSNGPAMSPPHARSAQQQHSFSPQRGSGRGRGRGNFDNRSGRGRGRGGFNPNNNPSSRQNNYTTQSPSTGYNNYAQQSSQPYNQNQQQYYQQQTYPQQQQQPFAFQPPPPPPQLTPQTSMYSNASQSFSPMTPMTPLPGAQYNFSYPQQQYPHFAQAMQQNYQSQQQQQQQQQGQGAYDNAAAMAQVQRQLEELRRIHGQG